MSNVLAIAFTTGEAIEVEGLPMLRVYKTRDGGYVLVDGMEQIEEALIESIKYLGQQHNETLVFKVEVSPIAERVKRINYL